MEAIKTSTNATLEGAKEQPQQQGSGVVATHNVKGIKKGETKKDYTPSYSDDDKKRLGEITQVVEKEIKRVQDDPNIPTVSFCANSPNAVIGLTEAYKNGIDLVSPIINRSHGKDEKSTGISIMSHGAQQLLLVITKKMADAAGMKVCRFSNDTKSEPIGDDALVCLNGNGRLNYFFGLEDEDKPQLFATFIVKDAAGFFNPAKAMEEINLARAMWKTQDLVQKRQLEDGEKSHPAWDYIAQLIKKGYMYQSACQIATLGTDRIKSKMVTEGDANNIFSHYESALNIHKALIAKFGEGDDKTLKTKEFTKEVSVLWGKLLSKQGEKWATDKFVKFINEFKDTKAKEIKEAKNQKDGLKKDEIRKNILNEQFNQFIGKENIDLD
jgi:hypothetical protein